MNMKKTINSREIAYLACLASERNERFISETLQSWNESFSPSKLNFNLAQEIAYGTCRMSLALNEYALQLSENKLNLKRKEKVLLFTALYQHYFLEKLPLYAIANETIEIAKKYCSTHFIKFLNVIFRKINEMQVSLPEDNSTASLSKKYSYPSFFIELLKKEYSEETVIQILEAGNLSPRLFARKRNDESGDLKMQSIDEIAPYISSRDYYIQNPTPASLLKKLATADFKPKRILDLCASPGGKLIASHDLFPDATLYANDVSENKLSAIRTNLKKYAISASLSQYKGEEFPTDEKYDLIILDVPCSNTGVLNKRAEARWRLTAEHLDQLSTLQRNLLDHAKHLLSEEGQIWYMTCSILSKENEEMISSFVKDHPFAVQISAKILPDSSGNDGGFGTSLRFK